ncbi:DNA-directed RNA polymerase III subunit RPC5 [Pectinophora gossypiella]|uniref:DNA-directed RNA polymerase III subunit RPC5 n=1 Tax=Pectinophora gossypiella TaxID=13191 RepID=UPI00214EA6B0|nr:DNA-directed RNA polymerase III subunit RPC5 [Pectinophora gossypiella]XP_049869430.1 DNA-directed RNA polymerase III subunit RPC5 [Pectinophora gossypiella]
MEEDDPVVQEIPVYLSQALTEHLYIYQFPVRPGNRDFKEEHVVNSAVKPRNKLVRLEVGLDTSSDNYCHSKGEQIALNTDGQPEPYYSKSKEKEKPPYFRDGIMDKIVYESSNPCTETAHYAVAVLQDKELHLTPMQAIVQLRPSYSYYDKQEKRKHDKSKAENSDDEEKEPEAQQVTVKFARQETEVAKKAREKSFEAITLRLNEEAWHDALFKHSDTDHADLERLKLFSATTSDGSALTVRSREYIRDLVPAPPTDEADVAPTKIPSPADQLRQILINAKLMTFNDLRTLIRTEEGPISETSLLSTLSAVACCVRGLWTARSSDLYTHASPVPPRLMCAARDHVLYLFTQHPYVDRRKVAAAVRLPPLEVLEIIRSVAKFNPRNGWELIVPPDIGFETKYPEVLQRQNLYWEARQRLFNDMLIGENVPKRQRKKSQRDSIGSDTLMSPKPRCNSVSEEDVDRKRIKNKGPPGSGKRTRNISSSSAQDGT